MGKSKKRAATRTGKPPGAAPSATTIAIADDQRLVGEALAALLATVDDVTVALVTGEATDLLELAKRDPPALVVIDVGMTQAFWVARWFSVHVPASKVILLDEVSQNVHLRRARDSGAAAYLTKSDGRADFVAAISHVLAGDPIFPAGPPGRRISQPPELARTTSAGNPMPELLTARELEVLALLATGVRVVDCARLLGVSPNTIDNHKARMMRKLAMHKTVELTRFAIRHGIVKDL